jgi:hypothetical protein
MFFFLFRYLFSIFFRKQKKIIEYNVKPVVEKKKIIECNAPCFMVIKPWVKEHRNNYIYTEYGDIYDIKRFCGTFDGEFSSPDDSTAPISYFIGSYKIYLSRNFFKLPHIVDLLDIETLKVKDEIDLDPDIKLVVNGLTFEYKLLYLCKNPNAIKILEYHIDKLGSDEIEYLINNPMAIKIIEYYVNKLTFDNWLTLSHKPFAIHLLEQNPDKINWNVISGNSAAIHLLEQNLDKINWSWLSTNTKAIHLLEQNPNKINWCWLCQNPAAIHLLEQNPDEIVWSWLSQNPAAIHLLEQNPDKIDWDRLNNNDNLFKLLKKYSDKIITNLDYNYYLYHNIFYDGIKRALYNNEILFDLFKIKLLSLSGWETKFIYNLSGIFTYDFDKIRQINTRINKEILEESNKRLYKPSLFLNPNSSDLEKEMLDYINIYE